VASDSKEEISYIPFSRIVPYALSVSTELYHSSVLSDWFEKCAGYLKKIELSHLHYIIFQHQAYATKVYRHLIENGYNEQELDLFPACIWIVHPLKMNFIRDNLMTSLESIVKECYKDNIPTIMIHVTTITFIGITGKTEGSHSSAWELYHHVGKLIDQINIQSIHFENLQPKHKGVLDLKVKQLIKSRENLVRKMSLHDIGSELNRENTISYAIQTSKEGFLLLFVCGLIREMRSIRARIRNIEPLICPQFKQIPLLKGDWEVLAKYSTFQKNNVRRVAIEENHSVSIKHECVNVFIYALCADDLIHGELEFVEFLRELKELNAKCIEEKKKQNHPGM
jgi:hypothetical protein